MYAFGFRLVVLLKQDVPVRCKQWNGNGSFVTQVKTVRQHQRICYHLLSRLGTSLHFNDRVNYTQTVFRINSIRKTESPGVRYCAQ